MDNVYSICSATQQLVRVISLSREGSCHAVVLKTILIPFSHYLSEFMTQSFWGEAGGSRGGFTFKNKVYGYNLCSGVSTFSFSSSYSGFAN